MVYENEDTRMTITCHETDQNGIEHGDFETTFRYLMNEHNDSCGCTKCVWKDRMKEREPYVLDKIKDKCKGKNLSFEKFEYHGMLENSIVTCHEKDVDGVEHGDFLIRPNNILYGKGFLCKKCMVEARRKREEAKLIRKAKVIHADKDLDYSQMGFVNYRTKVKLTCNKTGRDGKPHGDFEVFPFVLKDENSYVCPKCWVEDITLTTEEFITRAEKIHGKGKYDYSQSDYRGGDEYIKIGCKEHGYFYQKAAAHLAGRGCWECSHSHLEEMTKQLLKERSIEYVYQCGSNMFAWLGKLRIDIYLPEYGVAIECQGQQHFFPVDYAGKGQEWAEEKFRRQVELDERKKQLCEDNGIRLFYIRYDEDVEEALKRILAEAGIPSVQ